jgi:hypothetical protein
MRSVIAFLIAPLAVPLLYGAWAGLHGLANDGPWPPPRIEIVLGFAAMFTYAGTVVFGIPACLFLRARKLTAFWLAPVVGFVAGAIMNCIFVTLVIPSAPLANVLLGSLEIGGPLGAVVGAIFWLIARPDRQAE